MSGGLEPGVRLAMVVDSDAFGGAEVYAGQLLRRLPGRFRRALVVSEPVAGRLAPLLGPEDDLRVVPLARRQAEAPAVAAALAGIAPDVVHVNLVDPASNAAALAAAVAQAPVVATLHLEAEPGTPAAPRPLAGLYRRLAAVVAPSAVIARELGHGLGVPAERVVRIRHGVDLPAPRHRAAWPASMAPGGRSRPLRVGSVGRLTSQKGFDVLLEAARGLAHLGHAFELLVAGDGRDGGVLRRQAQGLPVRFLGDHRDVPGLLRTLDVFCLASRREALSLALLEALAHRLPCVTTAVGDTVEAVGDGALVVPPDDPEALLAALDAVLSDVSLRRRLATAAAARAVRCFDAERMVRQTAAVLAAAARRPADRVGRPALGSEPGPPDVIPSAGPPGRGRPGR